MRRRCLDEIEAATASRSWGWLTTCRSGAPQWPGSGRRPAFCAGKDCLFCLRREPARVGRSERRRASQRIVKTVEWTRCGTEVFLGLLAGRGLRGSARGRGAWSRTRWVTEQNRKRKEPGCGRAVLVVREVQPKKKLGRAGKALARIFHNQAARCLRILIHTPLPWGGQPLHDTANRFSGFGTVRKTAEAVRSSLATQITPLKWGVNESARSERTRTCEISRLGRSFLS
jgi:hypothetical protein